ncbi:hypothetical protein IscW_ISCW007372 [Ixodes scapularis]|uniref:Uncharacterized protein n=1 Tax=Ixodes scapularis TaxID=6945 RepID=B7PW10_IXOSC|nr:hypothetical protein IscW_ISCW007372 [Ixodes scapularis]|eukprot:XP_002409029.1 hypothetical protein IscW_ISCW007372 [Ixodes scapularis]
MSDMTSTSKKWKVIDMGTKSTVHQELSAGEQHGIVYKSIVGEAASVDVERAEQWLTDNVDEIYSYTVAARLTEDGQTLNDFINADKDVVVLESSSDEAIVREVWPTIQDIAASDDEDDDKDDGCDGVALSPLVSTMTALGLRASLKQLVYARGLSNVHIDQLRNLESAIIGSALLKQTKVTDFLE